MKVLCPIPGCRKRIEMSRFDYLLSHTENTAIHRGVVPDICKFDECNVTVSDYIDIEAFYREHYLPGHYNLNFSRHSRKRRRSETVSEAANNDYGFDGNCCPNFAVAMNSFTMEEESFRTILREELANLGIPQMLTEIREGIGQIKEEIGQLIQMVSENRVQNSFRPAALPSYKDEYTTVKKENQSSSKQLRMLPLLKAMIPPNQQFRTADNITQHVATMRGLLVSDEQKGILRDFANRHGLTEDDTFHRCGEYWINRAKNWKQWAGGAAVKPEFMELSSTAGKKQVNMAFAHAGIENNCSRPGTSKAVNALSVYDPFRPSASVGRSDGSRNVICPNAALAPPSYDFPLGTTTIRSSALQKPSYRPPPSSSCVDTRRPILKVSVSTESAEITTPSTQLPTLSMRNVVHDSTLPTEPAHRCSRISQNTSSSLSQLTQDSLHHVTEIPPKISASL